MVFGASAVSGLIFQDGDESGTQITHERSTRALETHVLA